MKQPISKLKEFFGAFKMPTANNFGDMIDSFFHKDGKIPASQVEGWTDDSAVILEPGVMELPMLGDKNKNVTVFGGANGRTYTYNGIPYFISANHQAILFWTAADQIWKIQDDVPMHVPEGVPAIDPNGIGLPTEKAVAGYVKNNSLSKESIDEIISFPNILNLVFFNGYYHGETMGKVNSSNYLSIEMLDVVPGDILNLEGYQPRNTVGDSGVFIRAFETASPHASIVTDLKNSSNYVYTVPVGYNKVFVEVAYAYSGFVGNINDFRNTFKIIKGTVSVPSLIITPRVNALETDKVDKTELGGVVSQSNNKLVAGGEVFSKTLVKQVYLNSNTIIGKNKFNKNKITTGKVMNSLGEIISSIAYGVTGPIPVKAGIPYIGSGGYSAANNKRLGLFETEESTSPVQFVSGSYSITPSQDGFIRSNIIDTVSNFSDSFQFEEGLSATSYASYTEQIIEKIKDQYLPEIDPIIIAPVEIENNELINQTVYANNINATGSGTFRKTVHIPNNYGEVLKNVVVPITLVNVANSEPLTYDRFVFLDSTCKNDFSDVRFIKSEKVLPIELGDAVNIKVQPFNYGLTSKEIAQSPVDGRYYCSNNNATRYSIDLKTWTTLIVEEPFVFVNESGDLFTSLGNKLKKYKYSENFSTGRVVIELPYTSPAWSGTRVTYDKFGHIYFGTYQGEFDARIWKSTDEGDSFSVIFGSDINKSQHCHNIKCDTSVEPNILYASFDGKMGGNIDDMSQWESYDYGATWEKKDISTKLGHQVDNGILFAEGDFLVGGSEGDAKKAPNIYYSIDRGDTWSVVEGGFQTFTAYKLKNYLVTQSIPRYNESVSKMCVMDRNGKVTTLVTRNVTFKPQTTGAGYRYGSTSLMKYQGKDCHLLVVGEGTTIMPALLVTSEVGEYSAEALIAIDELPLEGLDIEVHTGYSLPTYNQNLFVEKASVKPVLERKYQEVFHSPYPRHSSLIKDYTLFSDKKMKSLSEISLTSNLQATPYYTVSFWISSKGYQPTLAVPIIKIFGNDLIIFNPNPTTLRYAGVAYSGIFYGGGEYKAYMLTLSVSNGVASVYINQSLKSTQNITDAQLSGVSINGSLLPNTVFISDLKIYNKSFTLTDVRKLFSYNQVI